VLFTLDDSMINNLFSGEGGAKRHLHLLKILFWQVYMSEYMYQE